MKAFCVLLLISASLTAGEQNMAEVFTSAATTLLSKGKADSAEDMLFKALAYNENFVPALFELAKLRDKANAKDEAVVLYQRVADKATDQRMKVEALGRIAVLNPLQGKLNALMLSYAADLERIGHLSESARLAALERAEKLDLQLPSLRFSPVGKWTRPDKSMWIFEPQKVTLHWASGNKIGTWSMKDNRTIVLKSTGWNARELVVIDMDNLSEGDRVYTRQK